jgi:hypothetical protein
MQAKFLIRGVALLAAPALCVLAAAAIPADAASHQQRPGPAYATNGHRSASPAAVTAAAKKPSAVAGYVWTEDETQYDYNTSGGAVTVADSTPAAGYTEVTFSGLQAIGVTGDVQVTSYDTADTCVDAGWQNEGATEIVAVACYTPAGVLDTSSPLFDLTITKPRAKVAGVLDYGWVDHVNKSGKLSGLGDYNSSGKTNRVTHLATGRYEIRFPGPASSGVTGTVEVTPFKTAGGNCVDAGWKGTAAGQQVLVDCYSATGARQNDQFTVVYASGNNILGLNHAGDANALFGGSGGILQPRTHYYSAASARGIGLEYNPGEYEADFAGAGGDTSLYGGDVQVEAVSPHDYHCFTDGWDTSPLASIGIYCESRGGKDVATPFTVQWVVPG